MPLGGGETPAPTTGRWIPRGRWKYPRDSEVLGRESLKCREAPTPTGGGLREEADPGEEAGVAATGLIVAAEAGHTASHGVLPAAREGVVRPTGPATAFLRPYRGRPLGRPCVKGGDGQRRCES